MSEDFEIWWSLYPRKVAKKLCIRLFHSLSKMEQRSLYEGTERYCQYWRIHKTHSAYIPHPATFIRQGRYEDQIDLTPIPEKIDKKWMFSNQGIEAKAKELGVIGNGYDTYQTLKEKCLMKLGINVQ